MKYFFFLNIFTLFLFSQDIEIKNVFDELKVKGTVVIQSLNNKTTFIYNKNRANKRLLPASTFKIPHTLIALNENIIKDENQIIKWDGKKRFLAVWNKNQTIKSAFQYSCVWCYQYIASKLSMDTYKNYLKKISYGNEKTGRKLTSFWLEGDIKISALEQINFLRQLYLNQLPFKLEYINLLKEIMVEEQNDDYILRAKTGWATRVKTKHGWYVGYIDTSKDVWFFATNLLIEDFKRLHLRKDITLEILRIKGIIR